MKNENENVFQKLFSLKGLIRPIHPLLRSSTELRKSFISFLGINLIINIVMKLFVFIFNFSTNAIRDGQILLGIVLFIIYLLQSALQDTLQIVSQQMEQKLMEIRQVFVSTICSKILGVTRNKVMKKDTDTDITKEMSSSDISNISKEYTNGSFTFKFKFVSILMQFIVFGVSIVGIILVAIEQTSNVLVFILSLLFCSIAITIISVIRLKNSTNHYEIMKEISLKSKQEINDLLNIQPLNASHSKFLSNNFITTERSGLLAEFCQRKKRRIDESAKSFIIALSLICVIVVTIMDKGIANINSTSFLSIVSFSTIFSQILSDLSSQIRTIYYFFDGKLNYLSLETDFENILRVYDEYSELTPSHLKQDSLVLRSFSHSYYDEKKENLFTLTSQHPLEFEKGKVTLLDGKSGAGKSTLIKILSGDIWLDEKKELISHINYNSHMKLGCKNLFEELVFDKILSKEDECRLIEILKGIKLYEKLQSISGEDVLASLKVMFQLDLSDGLEQRVLLARTLYHMGNSDMICLDEPISSLDTVTAKEVMKFIIHFCNKDKPRILLLVSHQYSMIETMIDKTYRFVNDSPSHSVIV